MNRSCEFCQMRYEQEGFIGTIYMCLIEDKEVKLDGYCGEFIEKKK